MRNTMFVAVVLGLASTVAGCATAEEAASPASTSDAVEVNASSSSLWSDRVTVAPDKLSFSSSVRASTELVTLADRVRVYADEYAKARANAPAEAKVDDDSEDAFAVKTLRDQKLEPIYLIGKRQSDALDADGSVKAGLANPNGYLRRAIGVTDGPNGEIVIATRQASIAEAYRELELRGMIKVTRPVSNQPGSDDQWEWAQNYPFSIVDLDLSKTLYQKSIGAGIGNVTVKIKDSRLKVTGNLDAGVSGRWVSPRQAHGVLTTNLDGQILIEGNFDGGYGTSSGEISIYRKSFDITSVGGFPLTFDFNVTAKCDLAANGRVNAQVGAKVGGSLVAGATYERDQGFDTVWTPTWPKFTRVGPTLTSNATVEGRCVVSTTSRVQLFDAAGPEATASAYLTLDANGQTAGLGGSGRAKVVGGIDARVAGSIRPFGVTLGEISTDPFHREWVLFDQPVTFGTP